MNQNSLLQNRINELYSAIINFVDNRVYLTGFYNAERLESSLNTQNDNHQSKGIYDKEVINFDNVRNNSLFVIQENGLEQYRIQFEQVFKQTLKLNNSPKKEMVTIRKDKYSERHLLQTEKSVLSFCNLNELNGYFEEQYQEKLFEYNGGLEMVLSISLKINSDGLIELSGLEKTKTIREFKGSSILGFPETFCVIDIETTGLDPHYDEIIEIAAIKVENGEIIETKSSLVKPSEEINEYISELTGITNEMVTNEKPIDMVLKDFMDFWNGYTFIGHNVNFDINFLYDSSIVHYEKPLSNDFVDTLRLARRLLPDLKNHKLKSLVQYFDIPSGVEHRALSDARKTLTILEELKTICEKDYESILAFEKTSYSKGFKASGITSSNSSFDENHPFFEKSFVFTGTLEKMVRRDAMQLVVDLGGICLDNVNKKTDFLVLGNQDYSKIKDGKSSKQKKAEKLKLADQDIEIISENVFYDMLDC